MAHPEHLAKGKGSAAGPVAGALALLAALALALGALAAWPGAASAAMGEMGESPSAAEQGLQEGGDSEAGEQLGLMPSLLKLFGASEAASGGGLPREGVGALFPSLLSVGTTPGAISTGIACHMDEVCGYDPCTCGKPDAWGHCACGGFEETVPTVAVSSSDEGVVRVAEAFGARWLVPASPGTATVSIDASLVHFKSAHYEFEVEVAPFGPMDVAFIAAFVLLAAAVAAAVFLLCRIAVKAAVRTRATRARWRTRAGELREEHPLTWKAKLGSEKRAAGVASRRFGGVRNPLLHDMLFSLHEALFVLLGGLALFTVLVPVSTTMVADVSVFNVDFTHEQLKYQLYAQDLGPLVNGAAVLFGAVLGMALFRFLLVKRATTAFFSVGLARVKLFFSRYAVGAACLLVGIGVPFAVSLALNVAALGLYEGQMGEFFYVLAGYLAVALASFSLAVIATVCAGTLFEACVFTAAAELGATIVLWGSGVLADFLLVGNAAGAALYGQDVLVEPSLLASLSWLNPLLFFADEGAAHQFFLALHPVYYPQAGPWQLVAGWFAVIVALAAAGAYAFCRRRGEQAEMAGRAPVFSLFAVAMFGLACFAAAVSLLGSVDIAVAIVVGAALFALVSVVMMFGPLRGRTPRRATLACVGGELAAMACAVLVAATGAFGYAGYIPELDEVSEVELSYNGSPSYLTEGFAGVSSGSSYYFTSYRTYDDAASIDLVRALHGRFIDTARLPREADYVDFDATVVPYDIVVRYRLNDGRQVARYYDQATIGELSSMLALDNDAGIRRLVDAVVTGDEEGIGEERASELLESPSWSAYRMGAVYAADGLLNRIVAVDLDDAGRAALLEAMASDLDALPASARYQPSSNARAILMFTRAPELDVASFGYSFNNALAYVTDEWSATMAWLEGNGVLGSLGAELDPRVVEKLTLQLDDPYASINKVVSPVARFFMAYRSETAGSFWITQDYGALKVIDSQEQIAQLLPSLRSGCYMTGGYLVEAKLRGIEAYVYLYLPSELVPDFV